MKTADGVEYVSGMYVWVVDTDNLDCPGTMDCVQNIDDASKLYFRHYVNAIRHIVHHLEDECYRLKRLSKEWRACYTEEKRRLAIDEGGDVTDWMDFTKQVIDYAIARALIEIKEEGIK